MPQRRPCCYVYCFNILPGKKAKADFTKLLAKLEDFNKRLSRGCRFEAVYETRIGLTWEPRFQIWFDIEGFSSLDDTNITKALQEFHQELSEIMDESAPHYNFVVDRLF